MSPRPRGQRGTVQQLGTTWRIGYREPAGPDGKRARRWKGGFASEREAEKALRKALTDIDQGTYTPPSDTTLGEFLRTWLEHQAACGPQQLGDLPKPPPLLPRAR